MIKKNIRIILLSTIVSVIACFIFATYTKSTVISNSATYLFFILLVLMIILHCYYLRLVKIKDKSQSISTNIEKKVIFIVGPFAKKWFSHTNDSHFARYSKEITWLFTSNIEELEKHLEFINANYPDTDISAFFPFFPDGSETNESIISQISIWKMAFLKSNQDISISCTLAIYAQLSNKIQNNTVHDASWLGKFNPLKSNKYDLSKSVNNLQLLLPNLKTALASDSQQAALGSDLLNWIENSEISKAISTLFSHSWLQLTNMIICDYGNGFTRHGAWSSWIEKHYYILPALGPGKILPPLPDGKEIFIKKLAATTPINTTTSKEENKSSSFFWSIWLATALIICHIGSLTWQNVKEKKVWQKKIQALEITNDANLYKKEKHIKAFKNLYNNYRVECKKYYRFYLGSKASCSDILNQIENNLVKLNKIIKLTVNNKSLLFNLNSAKLDSKSLVILKEIFTSPDQYSNYKFLIVGHSDNSGHEKLNRSISKQRADAVKLWLLEHKIITEEKIIIRAQSAVMNLQLVITVL